MSIQESLQRLQAREEQEEEPLWEKQQKEEAKIERRHRPELKELGVNLHKHVKYQSGETDCCGQLEVVEAFGRSSYGEAAKGRFDTPDVFDFAFVLLCCELCGATVAVQNPRKKKIIKKKERWDG